MYSIFNFFFMYDVGIDMGTYLEIFKYLDIFPGTFLGIYPGRI